MTKDTPADAASVSLHPDVRAFHDALQDLASFLRAQDEPQWASLVALCQSSIARSDYHGVGRYLSLLGGMGSLNDLVLHKDGRMLTIENDEFRALLARAGEMAGSFHRERAAADRARR